MALRVVIVDDERLARQELQYLLESAGGVEVVGAGGNGIEAVELLASQTPDVVFLDVQMPGLDGFGVLKRLIELRLKLPQVVFATAYDRYAVRAFEVNAVDYLLKPFDQARVAQTLDKARARLPAAGAANDDGTAAKLDALLRLVGESAAPPAHPAAKASTGKVVVRAQNRLLLVDQKDICFAAIDDGAISVATSTIEGQSNCRTLEELVEQLDPETFWRAHRSYVVNLQHIREVVPWFKSTYQLRMDDPKKTEIPVSRNQTKRLRELFNL
jgi:two-component system LytT family response regulator/two-component system response regulator LytT